MAAVAADAPSGYAETTRVVASRYQVPALADPAVARVALDRYVAAWGPTPVVTSPQRWSDAYAEVSARGLVAAGLDPGSWTTAELSP